jgi:sugar phosphate isomerase/epimerase
LLGIQTGSVSGVLHFLELYLSSTIVSLVGNMSLVGTSTSALVDKSEFHSLLAFKPEVIEFYNYPEKSIHKIVDFCNREKIRIGLHTPFPYDASKPLSRFSPTDLSREDVEQAIEMSVTTIRCAAEIEATHVVVHFPSPYADSVQKITKSVADAFLIPVIKEATDLKVNILIENLSAHPLFHEPSDYQQLLERYPQLNFCLDIGHAYQLGTVDYIHEFIECLGKRIQSCHIYNQCNHLRSAHVPVHASQEAQFGWIDLGKVVEALKQKSCVKTWILEPRPIPKNQVYQAVEGAQWFKKLVKS